MAGTNNLTPSAGSGTSDTIGRMMLQKMGDLVQAVTNVFPQLTGTSTSASIGTHGDVPAQVAGYLDVTLPGGVQAKIPFYLP